MAGLEPGTLLINPESRMIQWDGYIEKQNIANIAFYLMDLHNSDCIKEREDSSYIRMPIKLFINSRGGDVDEMTKLIAIMESIKTPVDTYCTSYNMSAGFIIYIAGRKRYISKHAELMYHQVSCGLRGTVTDIGEDLSRTLRKQLKVEEFVCSRTSIPMQKLIEVRDKKEDWYITPEEAIKLGIATDMF